ncbi:MAG: hypothetical protein RL264_3119 [Bacteroidota bacterium]|jgi:polysaccharide export outer membrane protein
MKEVKTTTNYNILIRIVLIYFLSTLCSCKVREKVVYFNNIVSDTINVSKNTSYNVQLKVDDFLSIIVTDLDEESTAPFNLKFLGNPSSSGYTNGNNIYQGYLIDESGYINFPVIGKIKLAGLSKKDAEELIQESLKEYLKSPLVTITIQNYKITVLGEVNSPGTFRIPNDRITILEAIGLSNDLKITGTRKNIIVIRDVNGVKTRLRVDLTDPSLFSSPVYYLRQNDVVYVEPNISAITNSTFLKSNGPQIISLSSLFISVIILLQK